MFTAANKFAIRLWKDESGVVLALTMIVFLTLFIMALAIYAVGDTVRLRIEVQNAADSAAYSAAIVQADCNSRVAALNRAMSWTYVQMGRMEMDYIVDKWLKLTLDKWDQDNTEMQLYNMPSPCNNGTPWYGTGKGVFVGNGASHKRILLNKHHWETTDSIKQARQNAAAAGKSYNALATPIDNCRTTIKDINAKEQELIQKLPNRVEKVVERILKGNISETWNDSFAGGGQIMYGLKQEKQPLDNNFRVLELDEENDFLRHSNYIPDVGSDAKDVFGPGADVWFVKEYEGGGPGLQRQYKQRSNVLISEWDWCSSIWEEVDGACVIVSETSGSSDVKGEDGRDNNYVTALAQPQVLKEVFFAKGGSLVVGVTRRVNNPLQFMVDGGPLGIVRPFTVNGGNRFMWTASAAIAGYNKKPPEDCHGEYEVTYENNSGNKLWNLKTSDWDAELIPLHRAWALGKNRFWDKATAGEILEDVKGGPWKPLYGGGGALGNQGGPKGMNEGAVIAYGGAEGWVVH
ncbi:MAG: pilus assembly protein TadG-related protein [bacterium]